MIEYQKYSLLYMYLLIQLTSTARFLIAEYINEVICTELLDLSQDSIDELREIVLGQMTYRPYGDDYLAASYMSRKFPSSLLYYQKNFPKLFLSLIVVHKDYYPEYHQRDNRRTFIVCKPRFLEEEIVCDNCQVVPYNLYLL